MTKTQLIIDLSKRGKTAAEIHKEVGGSLSYIYKVRSKVGKKDSNILETRLQKQIKKLSKTRSITDVAETLGCSRQYVHKVVKKKSPNILPFVDQYSEQDEYFTP